MWLVAATARRSSTTAPSSTAPGSFRPARPSAFEPAASRVSALRNRSTAPSRSICRGAPSCRASSTRTRTPCSPAINSDTATCARRRPRTVISSSSRRTREATRTRSGSPAAVGRWSRSPAASHPARRSTPSCPTVRSSYPIATATAHGSTAERCAGRHRRRHARPAGRPDRARRRRRAPSACSRRAPPRSSARLLPALTADDWYAALLAAQDHLVTLGITGWQDAIIGDYQDGADPLPAYLRADENGALDGERRRARCGGTALATSSSSSTCCTGAGRRGGRTVRRDERQNDARRRRREPHRRDARSLSRRRRLRRATSTGWTSSTPSELPELRHRARPRGLPGALPRPRRPSRAQCPGCDRGGPHRQPGSPLRHHLAHLQVVHPDDIARFAPLRATANIQSLWAQHDAQMDDLTIPYLGERRASWQYPFRALQAAGAAMCAGSDWPVTSPNPFLAIHVAVNRTLPAASGGAGAIRSCPNRRISLDLRAGRLYLRQCGGQRHRRPRRHDRAGIRRRSRGRRRRSRRTSTPATSAHAGPPDLDTWAARPRSRPTEDRMLRSRSTVHAVASSPGRRRLLLVACGRSAGTCTSTGSNSTPSRAW